MFNTPLINTTLIVLMTIAFLIAGMAIGVVSGWLTSFLAMKGSRELYKDALIGSLGCAGGFWGCVIAKTSYRLPSTIVAVTLAILLPCLYQLSRRISLR